MITTRFMELRRRRGLMIALHRGEHRHPGHLPRRAAHLPRRGPQVLRAGRRLHIFTSLVAGFMYVFGFIVAAVVGCTAGSIDLTEGMFRHLVITGRSRLALYFARIPAGLAIVIAIVAVGYTIVCAVCVFAAPAQLNYDGVNVPQGLSRPALDSFAASHADEVICNFNFNGGPGLNGPPPNVPCGNGQTSGPPPGGTIIQKNGGGTITVPPHDSQAQIRAFAVAVANQDYANYRTNFTVPSTSLMVDVGLWIALEATIGFIVGLGLASLMGQRTVAGDPPHRARADPDADLQPPRHRAPAQCPAGHRRRGDGAISSRAGSRPRSAGAAAVEAGGRGGPAHPRVHLGVVVGDRGLDRVLDRHRGLADDNPGRLTGTGLRPQPTAKPTEASNRSLSSHSRPAASSSRAWRPMWPGFERTQYMPVLAATSGDVARKIEVLAPRRGLIWTGRIRRDAEPHDPGDVAVHAEAAAHPARVGGVGRDPAAVEPARPTPG